MNFTQVNEIPKVERCRPHRVRDFINEFIDSEFTFAKVNFNEHDYKSPLVCYKCLWVAIKLMDAKLTVRVAKRGDEVYLLKTNAINAIN